MPRDRREATGSVSLLADMKPCWDSDASGNLFRATEFTMSTERTAFVGARCCWQGQMHAVTDPACD
jgi:hypothetical protein